MFKTNLHIFSALLHRDLKVITHNFKALIFDSILLSSLFSLLFGYFLPTLGMPVKLSGPLFIGTVVTTFMSISFSRTVNIKSDMESDRFIDYHFTLPISRTWLIAEYIIAFTMDLLITTVPMFLLGFILLKEVILIDVNIISLILILIVSLFFLSTLFLILAFGTTWNWFINNTWERILGPLTHIGSIFFIWNRLNVFSPTVANIALLNPVTYIAEGLRSAIFSSEIYIPAYHCVLVLTCILLFMFILLAYVIRKNMDPV